MSDFVKEIHNMFDHIWDCEIDHPVYQDTVGELMEAVIQTYEKHKPTLSTNLASLGTDCISRQAAIDAIGEKSDEIYKTKQKGATYPHDDFFQGMAYAENVVKQLPPILPEIVRCEYCKHRDPEDKKCDCGHDILWQLPRRNDWFCADGER